MERIATTGLLLGLMVVMSGCFIGPRGGYHEGQYDRDHNRYYHQNTWHDCGDRDEHCH